MPLLIQVYVHGIVKCFKIRIGIVRVMQGHENYRPVRALAKLINWKLAVPS